MSEPTRETIAARLEALATWTGNALENECLKLAIELYPAASCAAGQATARLWALRVLVTLQESRG